MASRAPILAVAAYLFLCSAWLLGNPPGAAPDEDDHYLKALAAGRGEIHLDRPAPPPPDMDSLDKPRRWHVVTSRLVSIPASLDPAPLTCTAFRPEVSAGCLHGERLDQAVERATIVGPYQPFTYVVPGFLMRLAHDPESATRFGRLGFLLASGALLALAVVLLWSPGDAGYSLLGLLCGITPMVAFMVSTLSANGLEIAAGICFASALLRLARPGESRPWTWGVVGGSGALLALSRVTGVLWLGLLALAVVALLGRQPAVAALRRGGWRAAGAAMVTGAAVLASVGW